MKTCFKCKTEKPLDAFYKHRKMADGHLNKCIDCTKLDVSMHRTKNLDRIRQYDRQRAIQPHRIANSLAVTAKYRIEFPERSKANAAVARAVKNGTLRKQPCWCCGSPVVEGHHPDYSRPLDVVWLCPEHHKAIHLKNHHNDKSPPSSGLFF